MRFVYDRCRRFTDTAEINYGIFKILVKVFLFKKIQEDCRRLSMKDYQSIKKIINVKTIKNNKLKKHIYVLRDKLESLYISV